MPKFILAYHGKPDFQSKEQGVEHMQKWKEWSRALGDAVVDPGMPAGASVTVSKNGVTEGGLRQRSHWEVTATELLNGGLRGMIDLKSIKFTKQSDQCNSPV